ncbi:unnamed protein product [Amoebophrya sp. A25]|nr:unnamed protein product [Amoebophrya sp. A25]|eukprot:GSA25T00000314001.1
MSKRRPLRLLLAFTSATWGHTTGHRRLRRMRAEDRFGDEEQLDSIDDTKDDVDGQNLPEQEEDSRYTREDAIREGDRENEEDTFFYDAPDEHDSSRSTQRPRGTSGRRSSQRGHRQATRIRRSEVDHAGHAHVPQTLQHQRQQERVSDFEGNAEQSYDHEGVGGSRSFARRSASTAASHIEIDKQRISSRTSKNSAGQDHVQATRSSRGVTPEQANADSDATRIPSSWSGVSSSAKTASNDTTDALTIDDDKEEKSQKKVRRHTYCILYADETFLCPNEDERERMYDHVLMRQHFFCYMLVFLIAIGFAFQSFVVTTRKDVAVGIMRNELVLVTAATSSWWASIAGSGKVRGELMSTSLTQGAVVLGAATVVGVLIALRVVDQVGYLFFGRSPPARLDLAQYSIGDIREGAIFSESVVITLNALLVLLAALPFYFLFVFVLGHCLERVLMRWKTWEFSGFSERVLALAIESAESEDDLPQEMLTYLSLRRSYITPHHIYEKHDALFDHLRRPQHQFLLYMYLRPELADCGCSIITWPQRSQLLVAGALLGLFTVLHEHFTSLQLCYCAPVVALILKLSAYQVRRLVGEVLKQMVPRHGYFRYILEAEHHGGRHLIDTPLPVSLIPKWKYAPQVYTKQRNWVSHLWYGTFQPTRQEQLWPRLRNGPKALRAAMQDIFFFAALNCGGVLSILLTQSNFEAGDWLKVFPPLACIGFTVLLTLHLVIYDAAGFVSDWVLAAKTDTMTDQDRLIKAVLNMRSYFGDAALQEFLAALYLHVLYKEVHENAEMAMNEHRRAYLGNFTTGEQQVISKEFRFIAADAAQGLSQEEIPKLLHKLGMDRAGHSLLKWVHMLQLTGDRTRLQESEFEVLVSVYFRTMHGRMPRREIDEALIYLADSGETVGEAATHISVQKMVTILESVGMARNEAKRHAKQLLYRAHLFAEGAGSQDEGDADIVQADDMDWSLSSFFSFSGLVVGKLRDYKGGSGAGERVGGATLKKTSGQVEELVTAAENQMKNNRSPGAKAAAAAGTAAGTITNVLAQQVGLYTSPAGGANDPYAYLRDNHMPGVKDKGDEEELPLTEDEIRELLEMQIKRPTSILIHLFAAFLAREQFRRSD